MPDRDLYIIGPDGADILGRRLTESAARRLEFFNRDDERPIRASHSPRGRCRAAAAEFRPSARAADLRRRRLDLHRAPGAAPPEHLRRSEPAGDLPDDSVHRLVVSAFTSWWLAQHLSAPIRRIQEGARALAARISHVRVSAGLEGRKDELAVLARDFDAMADRLRANRGAITRLLRDISHELRSPARANARGSGPGPPADRRPRAPAGSAGARDRAARLADQPGLEARAVERHRRAVRARGVRPRRNDRGGGARRELRGRRQGLQRSGRRARADRPSTATAISLRSAIENVLRNAVRYSPQDAPVEVARGAQRRGGSRSRFGTGGRACPSGIWSAFSSPSTGWPNRATAIRAATASGSPSPLR